MEKVFILLCLLIVTGCVTGPVDTGQFETTKKDRETAAMLNEMAAKCWARSFNLVQMGIEVENRVELSGYVISARPGPGSRGNTLPIVRVTVSKGAEITKVTVAERKFDLFEQIGEKTRDVERWLAEDRTCR